MPLVGLYNSSWQDLGQNRSLDGNRWEKQRPGGNQPDLCFTTDSFLAARSRNPSKLLQALVALKAWRRRKTKLKHEGLLGATVPEQRRSRWQDPASTTGTLGHTHIHSLCIGTTWRETLWASCHCASEQHRWQEHSQRFPPSVSLFLINTNRYWKWQRTLPSRCETWDAVLILLWDWC